MGCSGGREGKRLRLSHGRTSAPPVKKKGSPPVSPEIDGSHPEGTEKP